VRLVSLADGFLCGSLSHDVRSCVVAALDAVRSARAGVDGVLASIGERCAPVVAPLHNLRVGFGVPGVLGCSSADGNKFLWAPLLHPQYGVRAAFDALSLDIAGLLAARIPLGSALPKGCGWQSVSRGGASYQSGAVLWRHRLFHGS
jgi:hypothetical protein